jgi:hypothetical protein
MANPYFPVNMSAMGSTRNFYDLEEGPVDICGAKISSAPLNHPQGCVGYRIEADGGVFVLATDTEPGSPTHDRSVRELARGADVLVYDAQYTPEQLAGERKGWGHGSWLEGVRIAQESGVKRLLLFHHDPDSNDAYVDGLVANAQREFSDSTGAAEGLSIDLLTGELTGPGREEGHDRRVDRRYHLELPVRLEWNDSTGKAKQIQGVAKDISKSGIYLLLPVEINPDQPFGVELVLPDEITHRGDLGVRFTAKPVRQEPGKVLAGAQELGVGVGARLHVPPENPTDRVSIPSEHIPN